MLPSQGGSGRGWRARGGRGGTNRGGARPKVCRNFQQTGECNYGTRCTFSHDLVIVNNKREQLSFHRDKPEQTFEQQMAKDDYNTWKRIIKTPPITNDIYTMENLWTGALAILNGEDREGKMKLPRDLDDEDYHGRKHILAVMNMDSRTHGCQEFVDITRSFLSVITHAALLHCLSVDTSVGALYNFISGSNGNRAVLFFQRLSTILLEATRDSTMSRDAARRTLVTLSTAICEVLRREQRASFHEGLSDLVVSLNDIIEATGIAATSSDFQPVVNKIAEIRAMIGRANGLLNHKEESEVSELITPHVVSTFPMEVILPGDRHDNDKLDITKIEILPTQDEIRSDHAEFLPSTDINQLHFLTDPAERHIDTYFRLLRHDIFGELKQALGRLMIAVENDPDLLSSPKIGLGDIRAYPYPNAHVRNISYEQRRGLEAQISFPQLPALRKMSSAQRRTWWEDSRRLEEGILLCLVTVSGAQSSMLFFIVSNRNTDTRNEYSLTSHDRQSTITAKLASGNQPDMDFMIRLSCENVRGVLIEFPGIILATFVPILENLQNMQHQSRLPFRHLIAPDRATTQETPAEKLDVLPPIYARRPGFRFSLNTILRSLEDNCVIEPNASLGDAAIIDEIEAKTNLDRGQCQALVAALCREFAFIQGPPGTGKSYLGVHLMRVLLSAKAEADLGPIVVVCYTNHALDQFLEHLVAVGIEKVIRIGGQSQSTVLEGKNLRVASKGETRTKHEGWLLATTYKKLEESEASITKQLRYLHSAQKRPEWASLQRHLAKKYPLLHSQFKKIDRDGFEVVGKHPFDIWMGSKSSADPEEVPTAQMSIKKLIGHASQSVNSITKVDRRRLLDHWKAEMREEGADQIFESVKSAESGRKLLSNLHDDVDRRVLQMADVIGVTTTGLARRIATLKHVKCKVVICEEAGEVMEPHMLSALLPGVEHFIQIGDHQQLRPQINDYGLSLESQRGLPYQLDRSQFERLSVGERGRQSLPVAQLNVQRRMRPEISKLIRETIYPRLIDHPTTQNFPDVVGMRENVFWLDHSNMEDSAGPDMHHKSHSNVWEVEMTHSLVRHIIRQGTYSSRDIAVLTPYTGQLQKLRTKMRNDFEIVLSDRDQDELAKDGFSETSSISESGQRPLEKKKLSEMIRLGTVDNMQGEEALIIIVSLVRSNKEKKVGFLRTTNRINVLLSRAQHGMYIIGNSETYSNVPMWGQVIGMLQAAGSVGNTLGLCCPRHPDTEIQVCQPDDFARHSPEGGCELACDRRLSDCGHRCQARCHSESMHQVFSCPLPCQRLHSACSHSCQKATCGEDCGLCMVKIDNVLLPCGHLKDKVPCHQSQDTSTVRCNTIVAKNVPECGHIIQIQCWQDVDSVTFRCPTACGMNLACGHNCPGTCDRCRRKDASNEIVFSHALCTKICGRRMATCNHTCPRACHEGEDCGPCTLPCQVRCAHSQCTLRCHEACAPCIEACTWSCEHKGTCSMPCAAPCVRLPCNERCSKKLSCGHQCPSICGEHCPEEYCQVCSAKGNTRVDLIEMKTYQEIDLNETPVISLGCGHFFTAESLDGLVGMGDVYQLDGYGNFTGLKDISHELARSIPCCPDCRSPVRQHATYRYNRVVNRAVIDEMSKRFLVDGQQELRALDQRVEVLERSLDTSRPNILRSIGASTADTAITPAKTRDIEKNLKERHAQSMALQKAIKSFCSKAADKHQPARKLYDATVQATRLRSINEMMADLAVGEAVPSLSYDRRVITGGRMMQIKVEHIVLEDKFALVQALESTPYVSFLRITGGNPGRLAKPFFAICKAFIVDCTLENLPKLRVEATLSYAKIAHSFQLYSQSTKSDTDTASEHVKFARVLLDEANELCNRGFRNAETLKIAVEELVKLLRKPWYEAVTPVELAAIKAAMVSGSSGIATHSGHWYNCANGHPFAIGDCGMPMEEARCPECGASIGGQNHRAVEGVTRATQMEL